jgi:hypothetical protein
MHTTSYAACFCPKPERSVTHELKYRYLDLSIVVSSSTVKQQEGFSFSRRPEMGVPSEGTLPPAAAGTTLTDQNRNGPDHQIVMSIGDRKLSKVHKH